MKKIILLLLVSLFYIQDQMPLSGYNIKFSISDFKTKQTGSDYIIIFNVNYSGVTKEYFDDSRVALSTEKYRISGIVENETINEKDFLYSRISFNISGKTNSDNKISINSSEGNLSINGKKIKQLISKKNYDEFEITDFMENDKINSHIFNESAVSWILFDYDTKTNFIKFGIGDSINPVSLEYFQNPCVEIIIAQETDSLLKIPSCTISGNSVRQRFSNDMVFTGQEWIISESWTALPLKISKSGKESMQVSISNIKKPFAVIASVKFSLKEGTTLSTRKVIHIID
jgi:hypothetical protein